jgi:Flp pilus assembly protein TadD
LGYALREAGKINEAITAWKQSLEIQPHEPLATAALQPLRACNVVLDL